MGELFTPPAIVVLLGVVVATITDVQQFKIYNLLTLPLMLTGLGYQLIVNGTGGLTQGLLGMALPFVVLLVPYMLGAMGAGDVKLMMAFGAWLGPQLTMVLLGLGLVFTAIYSFILLLFQGRLRDSWYTFQLAMFKIATMSRNFGAEGEYEDEAVRDVVKQADRRKRLVPFSIMAGLGAILAILYGEAMMKWIP